MKTTLTNRTIALITGTSLILMTIIAGLTMGGVFAPLLSMDLNKLTQALPQYGQTVLLGLIGWVLILIMDVIVSWGVYRYYRDSKPFKAIISGMLRMIYSLILGVAIIQLILAYIERGHPESFLKLLNRFEAIWQFGLIIFGIHLLYLAPLVCKKKSAQQLISALLFIAGIGYVLSNILNLFISDYDSIRGSVESVFILPMILGEFGLASWLVIKGGKQTTVQEKQCVSGSC